jgi:hypothetical protein
MRCYGSSYRSSGCRSIDNWMIRNISSPDALLWFAIAFQKVFRMQIHRQLDDQAPQFAGCHVMVRHSVLKRSSGCRSFDNWMIRNISSPDAMLWFAIAFQKVFRMQIHRQLDDQAPQFAGCDVMVRHTGLPDADPSTTG